MYVRRIQVQMKNETAIATAAVYQKGDNGGREKILSDNFII